jgi:hypothetical protein
MEYKFNLLQKLDLYQVISYAKEGDSRKVIERVEAMLKTSGDEEPVTLNESQRKILESMSIEEILGAALRETVLKTPVRESSSPEAPAA